MRHNSLRDECFFRCLSIGLEAAREMSGFLPSDPRRRPADVFIQSPATIHNSRSGQASTGGGHGEAPKLEDRQTAQRCLDQGFKLIPMVAETLGGWGPEAQSFFRQLAKATADKTGVDPSVATCQLYESLGIKIQRANARAILARAVAWTDSRSSTTLAATSRSEAALVLTAATPCG